MLPIFTHTGIFLVACLIVWLGSGFVMNGAQSLARFLKVSSFTFSFFVLGMLTSLPEIMIGTTAVVRGEPELVVGNLIGGSLVLFLLAIPILALASRGLRVPQALPQKDLAVSLITIAAPALIILDRTVSIGEAILLVALYLTLTIILFRRGSIVDSLRNLNHPGGRQVRALAAIGGGIILIFAGSQLIVQSAEYYAATFSWSPFVVGLLIVAIGTNIPEISLSLRAVLSGKQSIALADYLGSAATNTVLIGIFALASGRAITLPNHGAVRIIVLVGGLLLFFVFARSKKTLSVREALLLLALYAAFVTLESRGA